MRSGANPSQSEEQFESRSAASRKEIKDYSWVWSGFTVFWVFIVSHFSSWHCEKVYNITMVQPLGTISSENSMMLVLIKLFHKMDIQCVQKVSQCISCAYGFRRTRFLVHMNKVHHEDTESLSRMFLQTTEVTNEKYSRLPNKIIKRVSYKFEHIIR